MPLTAIRMPLGELGATAIGALAAQIDGEPARDLEVTTAPLLVLRASTAPRRETVSAPSELLAEADATERTRT